MRMIPRDTTDNYYSREPLDYYSPELLDTLTDTFKVVWGRLYAYVPPESTHAKELQVMLGSILLALASDGISDPKMLRRRALERMALRT